MTRPRTHGNLTVGPTDLPKSLSSASWAAQGSLVPVTEGG